MKLRAQTDQHEIYRTVLAVALMYLVVLTATLSPLKQMMGFIGTSASGQSVICFSGDDHSTPDQDQHKHQSDCCVLCGRHDVAAPLLGLIVETITIPTRLPAKSLRFSLFQSRAPPSIIFTEQKARAPPLPA